jgi:murein DD-endopeptidase MepM/ murein hydrolase activator NlpD
LKDIRIGNLECLTDQARAELRDKNLRKACQDFESIFTYQLLKSMRRTVDKCALFSGGMGEDIYESMLDQEISKSVSDMGYNSLAHLLYQQFSGESPAGADLGQGPGTQGGGRPRPPLWPLNAPVSSEFGWREDPILGGPRFHQGIDLAAGEGTPVGASLPGRVVRSGFEEGYGNVVVLDHGNGFTTLYAHNQANLVREGDWVERNAPIAKVGSSGRSTGPHLHFEVRRYGRNLDPYRFLGAGS